MDRLGVSIKAVSEGAESGDALTRSRLGLCCGVVLRGEVLDAVANPPNVVNPPAEIERPNDWLGAVTAEGRFCHGHDSFGFGYMRAMTRLQSASISARSRSLTKSSHFGSWSVRMIVVPSL